MALSLIKELESARAEYGDGLAGRKLELINRLRLRSLGVADLRRFHEQLCWLRAYPDDDQVLSTVTGILEEYGSRTDLDRHRDALVNTGIGGTRTYYRFFWPTARWLASRWPDLLFIDWSDWENSDRLYEFLPLLLPYCESLGLDEADLTPREWIETLKGPEETDATFLIRRFEAMKARPLVRESIFDSLDVPMWLEPGPDTPARGAEYHRPKKILFHAEPPDRSRPDLLREAGKPPGRLRTMPPAGGRKLIDLARGAMVNRCRDLDSFANADPLDVSLAECGRGLQIALYGAVPERRLLLESTYGYLTLENGVPTGYGTISGLFGSAAVAYNIFEAYRGGSAAWILGRIMATARSLFGADTFSLEPYQLGKDNLEGLKSGAWWFYYKLGFRPVDPDVLEVLETELRKMKRNRRHRSDLATLKKLVNGFLYLHIGRKREDVLGKIDLGDIGLAVSRFMAGRFGSGREGGLRRSAAEAARLFGVRSRNNFSPGERLSWRRWSPLLLSLPGVEGWTAGEKREAVRVVRAKGGRHESGFVRLFDRHRKLRRAVLSLQNSMDG